jgi:hypothetical protein
MISSMDRKLVAKPRSPAAMATRNVPASMTRFGPKRSSMAPQSGLVKMAGSEPMLHNQAIWTRVRCRSAEISLNSTARHMAGAPMAKAPVREVRMRMYHL